MAVSRTERLCLRQPIHREPALSFGKLEPIDSALFDSVYWELLPVRPETISPEEATELNAVFGIDGELSARWL